LLTVDIYRNIGKTINFILSSSCIFNIYNITADINIACKVNVHYEPPEDDLVKAETCVGVKG
jgi:hypothetical protein